MKRFSALLFFSLFICRFAFASGEPARILVHTLNYLGADYKHAVVNGKVADEEEYKEQLEFAEHAENHFKEFSKSWSDKDSIEIGQLIERLTTLIKQKGNADTVTALAMETRNRVIAVSGLKTAPTIYPDIAAGKKLFAVECAKCHGVTGHGDGPEGLKLEPKPRNFHEEERIAEIAPSHVFNTVRLGVEGTGMKPHPTLTDEEVWNLAFYVLTLRYKEEAADMQSDFLEKITLEKRAIASDEDLKTEFGLTNMQLGLLRLDQPKQSSDQFLSRASEYLTKAQAAYENAQNKSAIHFASLAYLEGIEPIELQLRASDPELSERLERQFQQIRKMITENRPTGEVNDSIVAARVTLAEVSSLLEKKEYSFWMSLFMSISILLREGLEAFLVILVILSVLKAANISNAVKWIHAGWITALLAGIVLWILSGKLIAEGIRHMELLEGIISLVAVAMLLYVGLWMHGKSEAGKWTAYVKSLVNGAVSDGSAFGLAVLSFFVVFREVFESVLFLSALNIEGQGKQNQAILLGVVIAFVLVVALATIILRFSTKLPVPKFFKISSIVMGILAVVLAGKGIHSLQEVAVLPVHGVPMFRFELLGIYPTAETCGIQLAIIVVVVALNFFGGGKAKT